MYTCSSDFYTNSFKARQSDKVVIKLLKVRINGNVPLSIIKSQMKIFDYCVLNAPA